MIKLDLFLQRLHAILNMQTKYRLGYFMNKSINGHYLVDCSGLIKACIWNYPINGRYEHIMKDINADTMIQHCTVTSTDFKKIEKGCIVHQKGHIGVYIGDGIVIESTPKWSNGVQMTFCSKCGYNNTKGLNVRDSWTSWGKLKYIQYNDSVENICGTILYKAKVVNAPNGLRVRNSPINGEILRKLTNGTEVSVYDDIGNWCMINNNEWVCKSYLSGSNISTSYTAGRYYVNCDALIVRKKPTTDSKRIPYDELTENGKENALPNGCLKYGTAMDVSKVIGNWGKIPSGYVCLDYCRR